MRPNGLELSCPAARALPQSLYGSLAGNTSPNFPDASRVSCSELLGGGACSASSQAKRDGRAVPSSGAVRLLPRKGREVSPCV
jgi:hypothetical protein